MRASFALSAAVTAIFFTLVLVMAFQPRLLTGYRGLSLSLAFILFTLVVMGGYSWWRIARAGGDDE
jgi:hypothetical protein